MTEGINLPLGQSFAQGGRVALPVRRIVERGFLCGVVIGDRQCHQLVKIHRIGPVVGHQTRRDIRQFQATLHHQGRNPKISGNIFDGSAFRDQVGERLELVSGVHSFALYILGQAGSARRRIGHQQARHRVILGNAPLLRQQLQCRKAATTGHHFVMLAIAGKRHGQVLQQAYALDAGG